MLGLILEFSGVYNVAYIFAAVLGRVILEQRKRTSRRLLKTRAKICVRYEGEDRISALPDDLLVQILLLIPTKEAVATMILSKRWRFIWTMMPKLKYVENLEIKDDSRRIVIAGLLGRLLNRLFDKSDRKQPSNWHFVDHSLQLHKAPVLESLVVLLRRPCPVGVDVGNWILDAVYRKVRELGLKFSCSAELVSLPKRFYTCNTLVSLGLYNKILIDVPSPALFPSLKGLGLYYVVYKDDDSIVRLLSSCPVLKYMVVYRYQQDNVKNFTIKVPSLECLVYNNYTQLGVENEGDGWTLVIDSPALKKIFITDYSGDSCSIENKPRFNKARISVVSYPDDKFLRSLFSLKYLELYLSAATFACCYAINFSQLMDCKITLIPGIDWMEPLMLLLQNSPNLKVFFVDQTFVQPEEDIPFSWNQPNYVPGCLSTYLEIFEWKEYGGKSKERETVRYILANSKRLKRAGISVRSTCDCGNRKNMMEELESMLRISTSSELQFSTQLEYMNVQNEISG